MGQAKRRGTYTERVEQAIASGDSKPDHDYKMRKFTSQRAYQAVGLDASLRAFTGVIPNIYGKALTNQHVSS